MTAECQDGPSKGQTVMHSSLARFYWVLPDGQARRLVANDTRLEWPEIEKATGVYVPHVVRSQGKAKHVLFYHEINRR